MLTALAPTMQLVLASFIISAVIKSYCLGLGLPLGLEAPVMTHSRVNFIFFHIV